MTGAAPAPAPADEADAAGQLFPAAELDRIPTELRRSLSWMFDQLRRQTGIDELSVDNVVDELTQQIEEFAQTHIVQAVARSWRGWRTVQEAARRTAGPPPTTETLVLGPHSLESEFTRTVELIVNERKIAETPIVLKLTFTTDQARVTVSAGRAVRLRPGQTTVVAEVTASGEPILSVQRPVRLPRSIPLGRSRAAGPDSRGGPLDEPNDEPNDGASDPDGHRR